MRSLLALASLLSVSLWMSGCVPLGGCGAFAGGDDKVYSTGTERLIACSNGGYVMTLADGTHEGHLSADFVADDGATGAQAFTIVDHGDGTVQALDRTWTQQQLDATALDHADVLCQALPTRTWWKATSALPVATAFARPASTEQLLLCPDGTAFHNSGAQVESESYSASFGTIDAFGMTDTFADHALGTSWQQVDVTAVAAQLGSCPL